MTGRLSADLLACVHALAAGDCAAAVTHADRGLAIGEPWAPELLAKALVMAGTEPARALKMCEQVLSSARGLSINMAELAAHAATENMRAGDFVKGARLLAELNDVDAVESSVRKWKGEPLAGKTVLMACGSPLLDRNGQVGFGDEILWARFAPALAARGAQVYLRCHPRILGLFGSLAGVNVTTDAEIPEPADYLVNAMTVPGRLGITREQIPAAPYLHAEALELPRRGLRIGLSWGCSPVGPQNRYCALAELSALAELPGVQLYSLDKTHHAAQLRPAPAGMHVIDLAPSFGDFADTAAAVNAMDAIVSTDNVIANLAGALGRPLFMLHSCVTPEYRWGDGERTPWYPSARVLRQPKPGDWRGAVAQVAIAVGRLALRRRILMRSGQPREALA